jgi:hypothetical protein
MLWISAQWGPSCSMRADGHTDIRRDLTKLIVTYFANAPTNGATEQVLLWTIYLQILPSVLRLFAYSEASLIPLQNPWNCGLSASCSSRTPCVGCAGGEIYECIKMVMDKMQYLLFTAVSPKETVSHNSLMLKSLISFVQCVVLTYIAVCCHCRNTKNVAQITI